MKGSFWNPDRKVLSRKSEIFLQIVAKKSKEKKSCSLKTLLEIKQSSSDNLVWKNNGQKTEKKTFLKTANQWENHDYFDTSLFTQNISLQRLSAVSKMKATKFCQTLFWSPQNLETIVVQVF